VIANQLLFAFTSKWGERNSRQPAGQGYRASGFWYESNNTFWKTDDGVL